MEDVSEDVKWLKYNELASALGIPRESARQLVIRRRWPRRQGNDGRARIAVPLEALRSESPSAETGQTPSDATNQQTAAIRILEHHVEHLEGEVEEAKTELDRMRTVLAGEAEVKQALIESFERQVAETRAEIESLRAERDGLKADCERWRSVAQERLEASLRAAQERAEAAAQAAAKPPKKRWWRRRAA
jgi:chromosome segregation ATPase